MKLITIVLLVVSFSSLQSIAQNLSQTEWLQYNSDGFVKEKKTVLSNGDIQMDRYVYVDDVVPSPGVCTSSGPTLAGYSYLKSLNILASPVQSYTVLVKAGTTTEKVTGGTLMVYYDNKPYPKAKLALEITAPISNIGGLSLMSTLSGQCDLTYASQYVLQESYDFYDGSGNVLQKTLKGDRKISSLYSYKGSYQIAGVQNAALTEISATSFEAAGGYPYAMEGNWLLTNINGFIAGGVTGSKSYQLPPPSNGNAGSSTTSLTANKQYKISYWQKTATGGSLSFTCAGQGITFGGSFIVNGWAYYEGTFTAGGATVSFQSTSGNPVIDELRLYPANAYMQTYTYVPGIGVSSVCDERNTVNYYAYDLLGRLLQTSDQYGHIIKRNEYGLQKAE